MLEKMGAIEAQKAFAHVPVCTVEELPDYDAIVFGTPTRFGNMCGQMRQFLDATGGLWLQGELVGKAGSVFASSATQHGGQESTILTFHTFLLQVATERFSGVSSMTPPFPAVSSKPSAMKPGLST
ncbi:hypothetical protein GPEL0_01f2705 [Geoanaerobacter pelophilus]|uniref:Flavodoxin-like domain-containing protein n=1 Tax=Geoanaerobacter pelophilus TaxID=60036 RepID=A0ABQ0MJ25_9BACT|nr:hypothetical protein GPEL0_01f2705 [Geoanaerobacter pelophilus]